MRDDILNLVAGIGGDGAFEPFSKDNFDEFSAGAWLPGENRPLSDEWVRENMKLAQIEPEAETELLRMAATVREDDAMRFLFFHCGKLLYGLNMLYNGIQKWPKSIEILPEGKTSMFYLLLGFHAIDKIVAIHESMGVSKELTQAICADVGSRVLISKEFDNGKIGISANCLNWLRHHAKGKLFQIGRLQFHLIQFGRPFIVYQHTSRKECRIVAEPGLRFDSDGFFDGAGFKLDKAAWESVFKESEGRVTANEADLTTGRMVREPVTFSLDEWIPVVNFESIVMNTHIPRGPRMTLDSWFESISAGFEFFESRTPPNVTLDAAVCFSWMFEPRLQQILPETSGLVSLQKSVNLFPHATSETNCGMYFIFGENEVDINNVPTDTSLRRGVVEHVKNGGILTGGSMVLLKEHLPSK
jgi:hypothetical protein